MEIIRKGPQINDLESNPRGDQMSAYPLPVSVMHVTPLFIVLRLRVQEKMRSPHGCGRPKARMELTRGAHLCLLWPKTNVTTVSTLSPADCSISFASL